MSVLSEPFREYLNGEFGLFIAFGVIPFLVRIGSAVRNVLIRGVAFRPFMEEGVVSALFEGFVDRVVMSPLFLICHGLIDDLSWPERMF